MGSANGGDPVHASVQRDRSASDLAAAALERRGPVDRVSFGRRLRTRESPDPGVFTTRAGAAVERAPSTDLRIAGGPVRRRGSDVQKNQSGLEGLDEIRTTLPGPLLRVAVSGPALSRYS